MKLLDLLKKKTIDFPKLMECEYVEEYNLFIRPERQLTHNEFKLLKDFMKK